MILKFLRMFSAYCQLEDLSAKQFTELAEVRRSEFVAAMRAEQAEQDRDRARGELTHALMMISNWQAVQAGAIMMPFPDVHVEVTKPVEEESANPKQPERMQMRLIQRQAVAKSRREAYSRSQLAHDVDD